MKKFPVPEIIKEFSTHFEKHGHKLYIVGGAIRDYLLGVENTDYDFCTDALPEEVISIFKKVIPTGIKHGTVTVLFKGCSFEVTTFRTEGNYSDNRHPDSVKFVRNLNEDLSRRDFTINAFASDCNTGKITDLFHGRRDLRKKTVKCIGNSDERFSEDALRLMRMCRFCSKLSFKPEKKTFLSAQKLSGTICNVSEERINDEISKILMTKKPSIGMRMLNDSGILNYILPELSKCVEIKQNKINSDNLLEHIFNAIDAAAEYNYSLNVRLACLFHDIAKPHCMVDKGNYISFHGHDIKGAEFASDIMKRLKFSNKQINDVTILIANHMVKYKSEWTDGAVKRFINRVGLERINELFELQWCDQIASEGEAKVAEYDELIERIQDLKNEPMTIKDLNVNGNDLAELGIPNNKTMGDILCCLLEDVIDNPEFNTKDYLKNKATELFKTKF